MKDNTRILIQERLNEIFRITDEILNTVNKDGIKIKYPFGNTKEEVEKAVFEYLENYINSHR